MALDLVVAHVIEKLLPSVFRKCCYSRRFDTNGLHHGLRSVQFRRHGVFILIFLNHTGHHRSSPLLALLLRRLAVGVLLSVFLLFEDLPKQLGLHHFALHIVNGRDYLALIFNILLTFNN